jgi:hypothetical protein
VVPGHRERLLRPDDENTAHVHSSQPDPDVTASRGGYSWSYETDLISRVTDAVADEFAEWQSRPLDAAGLSGGLHRRPDGQDPRWGGDQPGRLGGHRHRPRGRQPVLGLWVGPATGKPAGFWLSVLSVPTRDGQARGSPGRREVDSEGSQSRRTPVWKSVQHVFDEFILLWRPNASR